MKYIKSIIHIVITYKRFFLYKMILRNTHDFHITAKLYIIDYALQQIFDVLPTLRMASSRIVQFFKKFHLLMKTSSYIMDSLFVVISIHFRFRTTLRLHLEFLLADYNIENAKPFVKRCRQVKKICRKSQSHVMENEAPIF